MYYCFFPNCSAVFDFCLEQCCEVVLAAWAQAALSNLSTDVWVKYKKARDVMTPLAQVMRFGLVPLSCSFRTTAANAVVLHITSKHVMRQAGIRAADEVTKKKCPSLPKTL